MESTAVESPQQGQMPATTADTPHQVTRKDPFVKTGEMT